MAEAELIWLWRCDILQCTGCLQTPKDVRISALEGGVGKEHSKLDELQAKQYELRLQASNIQHLINHGSEDKMDSNGEDDEEDDAEGILCIGNLSLGPGEIKHL